MNSEAKESESRVSIRRDCARTTHGDRMSCTAPSASIRIVSSDLSKRLAKVEDPVGRACSRCRAERPPDQAYASRLLSASKKALKMPLGNHAALTPLEDMSAGRQASGGSPPNCQKIFIQRDYSEGTVIKFQTRFPAELENRLDRQTFEYTINQLNTYFAEAERATCSTYCEGCLACLTGYLIYICTETQYEKCLRKVAKFISDQNDRIYKPRGLLLTDPTARGLRLIEISILDRPAS